MLQSQAAHCAQQWQSLIGAYLAKTDQRCWLKGSDNLVVGSLSWSFPSLWLTKMGMLVPLDIFHYLSYSMYVSITLKAPSS